VTPERVEIDGALERGFGRLMALEAELQRVSNEASVPNGPQSRIDDLRDAITVLRDALTELRTLSSPSGPPRIGYGFVLPGPARSDGERAGDRAARAPSPPRPAGPRTR
jgi:hypothetical protein